MASVTPLSNPLLVAASMCAQSTQFMYCYVWILFVRCHFQSISIDLAVLLVCFVFSFPSSSFKIVYLVYLLTVLNINRFRIFFFFSFSLS